MADEAGDPTTRDVVAALHGVEDEMRRAVERFGTIVSRCDEFDRILRPYNGHKGLISEVSHISRSAAENKERLDKLERIIDNGLEKVHTQLDSFGHPVPPTVVARSSESGAVLAALWDAIGKWAVPVAAFGSLLLQLLFR